MNNARNSWQTLNWICHNSFKIAFHRWRCGWIDECGSLIPANKSRLSPAPNIYVHQLNLAFVRSKASSFDLSRFFLRRLRGEIPDTLAFDRATFLRSRSRSLRTMQPSPLPVLFRIDFHRSFTLRMSGVNSELQLKPGSMRLPSPPRVFQRLKQLPQCWQGQRDGAKWHLAARRLAMREAQVFFARKRRQIRVALQQGWASKRHFSNNWFVSGKQECAKELSLQMRDKYTVGRAILPFNRWMWAAEGREDGAIRSGE